MRTFIRSDGIWDGSGAIVMSHKSEKGWPGAAGHELHEIEVTHHVSTESDIFDGAKRPRVANFV